MAPLPQPEYRSLLPGSLGGALRAGALLTVSSLIFGQTGGAPFSRASSVESDTPKEEKTDIRMVRAEVAPKIDGVLNEQVWSSAPVISGFTQVRPKEGTQPSEKTEVRLLYDSNFLYLGVRAFDSEPKKIIAKVMQRDASLSSEDRMKFAFDTFLDSRNGFYFEINAQGARRDGLISPGLSSGGYDSDWDGIWYGKSRIDEKGWTTEVAIPAKTLSFNPLKDEWGFNVERDVERKNERMRWASPVRNKRVTTMSDAGRIEDLVGLNQGVGLDLIPFAVLRKTHDSVNDADHFELKPGLDLFYKITPAVTAAFTLNTDFAEAEVDDRRVNLTRFPLFFDEKRAFFLQDANIFRFSDISRSPLPFHSRRIGLGADREPIDIIEGLKITGRVGDLNFGVLNVQVEETESVESKNLTVARASLNLFNESKAGFIFTNGDPGENGHNTLGGFDFNYRNSNFRGSGQILEAHTYIMKTVSSGLSGDDLAFGAVIRYPNDKWNAGLRFDQIERNFNPALGFVRERGVREYESWIARQWHPENLDTIHLEGFGRARVTTGGDLVESEIWLPNLEIETNGQDELTFAPIYYREQLFEPFEIIDNVLIPVGDYRFNRYHFEFALSDSRPLNAGLEAEFGDFFTGRRTDLIASFGWRPSPRFNITAEYETNKVELPEGDFTVRILQVDINIQFSPDLTWNITNQYDNESDEFGLNSRLRWTIKPGSDLFLVFNQGIDTSNGGWRPLQSELSSKIAWTFRF